MENRSLCQVPCSHGGICTLPVDHEGLHSADGYCEWERSEDEIYESDEEALAIAEALLAQFFGEEE